MSLNKVMLIGNVGKEPDVRYIDNGVCTATLSLATNTPGYTLPNGTQVPERAEWHCCGDVWQKWWSVMFTRVTNSTWKVSSEPVTMSTSKVALVM